APSVGKPRSLPSMNRFSWPDSSSSTAAYCPVRPIRLRTLAGSRTTSYPPTVARPASGRMRVDRMRMAVVFPAPLGPSSPNTVPSRATMSMPSSARTFPNVLTRPSASIAEVMPPPLRCRTGNAVLISPDQLSSRNSSEPPEELAQVADQQVGSVRGGEVAAPIERRPVPDVVRALGERPDRPEVVGEHRDAGRRVVRHLPIARSGARILVVLPGGGPGRRGRPEDGHVGEEPVPVHVVHVLAAKAHEQLAVPRELAGRGVGEPVGERLGPGLVGLQVPGAGARGGEDLHALPLELAQLGHIVPIPPPEDA